MANKFQTSFHFMRCQYCAAPLPGHTSVILLCYAMLRCACCSCWDYIEIFPYLREAVIENSTNPDHIICNKSISTKTTTTRTTPLPEDYAKQTTGIAARADVAATPAASASVVSTTDAAPVAAAAAAASTAGDVVNLQSESFIYSAGKVFGIRVRFQKPKPHADWRLNVQAEYRFLKKDNFKNDGRLIPGSYCDYYFFADANAAPKSLEIWQYFHSPRFPAKYPAHIKCAYKFIGRPESRVEIIFEELQIPKQGDSCNMDKLTVFDSESANMNAVIDVVCDVLPTRRIISSGPDLLIEFNASSNVTAKGFRGKFKFLNNEIEGNAISTMSMSAATVAAITMEKVKNAPKQPTAAKTSISVNEWGKFFKNNENCKQTFDSRVNKSGRFDTAQLFPTAPNVNIIPVLSPSRVQCRFEFYGAADERIQIKFLDFHIPAETKNSSECKPNDSLQLLTQVRGKYEAAELFCGAFLPKPIMSKGPKMLLQFLGRYPPMGTKINYYGFKAEYKFIKNFGIATGQQVGTNCSFVYNSTDRKSGWFGSPNFPGFYPQNMICHYLFYGEANERVVIRFTFFDVEGIGTCEYLTASDYVEFSNFMSTDRKYGKYCGKRDKFEIRSDGRFFRVSFYSNDRFDRTGFRALYDFEGKPARVENTSMQSYVSEGTRKIVSTSMMAFILCSLYLL